MIVDGGNDEFQGNVKTTFTRPDGTQLGNQGLGDSSLLVDVATNGGLHSSLQLVAGL